MRLGIIGTGNIARRHLALLAETDGDVAVVAHLSRHADRAAEAASRYGGTPHTSLDEFITQGRPDAVIVTVPPDQHGEIEHALI
ncbi:hypothetical protein JP75_25405, partial [Devosia riboflavina]